GSGEIYACHGNGGLTCNLIRELCILAGHQRIQGRGVYIDARRCGAHEALGIHRGEVRTIEVVGPTDGSLERQSTFKYDAITHPIDAAASDKIHRHPGSSSSIAS